ncbi:MAG: hypothetical protein EXR00_00020 [Alphaproteobacteria bacterium]|nr:hypothetical protein [Alphaproteobacteria bacterium]
METMPIGATIARAYGFLIIRFFNILGLIWLPVAIFAVGAIAIAPAFLTRAARIAESGLSMALWRDEVEILALLVPSLMLFSVIAVSASRLALGLEKKSFLAHFTFGAAEWRLFLASLRLVLVLAGMVVAIGAIAYLLAGTLGRLGVADIPFDENGLPVMAEFGTSPALTNAVWAADLIAFAAVVYAAIRFGFLLPALAANGQASLRRALALSAGQFWRMLLVVCAIAIPVWMAMLVGSYFALGADFGRFYGFASDQRAQYLINMARIVAAHAPELIALKAAGLFLFSALLFGASPNAYRSLARPEDTKLAAAEELPPIVAPRLAPFVLAAVASATPVAAATLAAPATPMPHAATARTMSPAPTETSIERSLLEQFGARIHDSTPPQDALPPHETHVAAMHKTANGVHSERVEPTSPPADIIELYSFDEIPDASKNGVPPMPEKFEAPLAPPPRATATPAPTFGLRTSDSGHDLRK